MGTSFNRAIFDENVQEGLVGWAKQAKKNMGLKKAANNGSSHVEQKQTFPSAVQMTEVSDDQKQSAMEEGHNETKLLSKETDPMEYTNEEPHCHRNLPISYSL